jgi:dienelactone hydrolase
MSAPREKPSLQAVRLELAGARLNADLSLPSAPRGLVVFAHGSGSSRHSPRNRAVADVLHESQLATLLLDLLTEDEERTDAIAGAFRFDIPLLGARVVAAIDWAGAHAATAALAVGLFGASTGAAAALIAAAARPAQVRAVVSRGGRPDLAASSLDDVAAPTLLVVGGRDEVVIDLNRRALARLSAPKALEIIPGATHLFDEPGALAHVARLAASWFVDHLPDRAGGDRSGG